MKYRDDYDCDLTKFFSKIMVLQNFKEGILVGCPGLDDVKSLKSFCEISLHVNIGKKIPKTIDLTRIFHKL
jgi:hypothetical protein